MFMKKLSGANSNFSSSLYLAAWPLTDMASTNACVASLRAMLHMPRPPALPLHYATLQAVKILRLNAHVDVT